MTNDPNAPYTVYQFFDEDELYERIGSYDTADEAVKKAHFFTHNVAARVGLTVRVIITDSGDCIVFEWKFGQGVTWPKPDEVAHG